MASENRRKEMQEKEEEEILSATSLEEYPGKQNGSKVFFFRGYLYVQDQRKRKNENLQKIFRCHDHVKFGCQAKIRANFNNEVVNPQERLNHICGVPDMLYRRKILFKSALRDEAENSLEPLRKIFDEISGDDGK